MNDIHDIRIIGQPMSRTLHLVGYVNKALVTPLIDNIMAINREEMKLVESYDTQTKVMAEQIQIIKANPMELGMVGIVVKRPPVAPIELFINSGGGGFEDGMALLNAIRTSAVPVIAYVSNAYSMAGIIALACDEVVTYPSTIFMIHEVAFDDGYAKVMDHKKRIARAKVIQDIVDKIILENSEIPPEDLQAHYDDGDDWYLMGQDIRDYGLTNEVIKYNPTRDTTLKQD